MRKKLISLVLIFVLLLATFSQVFAKRLSDLEVEITDFNEPVANAKPSFNYDVDFDGEFGNKIEVFDFMYWLEYDEDYEDILELIGDMSYSDVENFFDEATRISYNRNNSYFPSSYSPSYSKITEFSPNKTYIALFLGVFYEVLDIDEDEEEVEKVENITRSKAYLDVHSTVNEKEANVFSLIREDNILPPIPIKNDVSRDSSVSYDYYEFAVAAVYKPIIPTSDIKATVNWNDAEGNIPDSLILKLMNGSTVVKEQTVSKANNVDSDTWEYTFEGIPTVDDNGNEITYTLAYEEASEGDLRFFNTTVEGFTINNTYIAPEVTSKVKMRSIVDREENNVKYKIDYSASIKKYSGNADVKITTTIPFAIDEEKSDLDGGTYDAKTRSIIWTETIEDIDNIYDYSATKNVSLYATAVLPYSIEATTVGEIKLANAEDFNQSVDTVDNIETGTGNPKTGDNNLVKYLSIGLIGIAAILMVVSIKRKYSTRKSKVQY